MTVFLDNDINYISRSIIDPQNYSQISLWNPKKDLLINFTHPDIGSDRIHEIKVVTCRGISDSYLFSI